MVTNEIAQSHDYSLQPTSVNRRNVLPSELTNTVTNTIEQFNVYVHRNEAHFTYIYVYHTNVFDADTIVKNPPKLSFHLGLSVLLFLISFSGSTHDSADCWSTHMAARSPASHETASNVCTNDALLGGVGRVAPQTKILATPVLPVRRYRPLSRKRHCNRE